MPRLSYPADWENFAVYFARARRTSNLSAAGIAKRLEDDGSVQRFELQSLVPLGGHASHTQVSKMEVCDCGGLWIRTRFGWHQANDFEIRYHPPTHKLRFELILRPADGDDDETKPVAPIKTTVEPRRVRGKHKTDAEKLVDAEAMDSAVTAHMQEHQCSQATALKALYREFGIPSADTMRTALSRARKLLAKKL